ncbi:DUF4190 domain-containing protein [Streptomyces sp. UNOB3_S3]|uniref:DUF4190 domain-containing protein n=1 Tax=Streptomyces sp. UNOB3_S3 TaxID=2871682 RepID=UPI001E4BB8D1|nr:DUF4190 domain-containing protein [Streptomyces sp. UNOB3_S3]MCC3776126.1 DUF4190 domain-containing protein [Streptomyces sp. UNOB3_S3]
MSTPAPPGDQNPGDQNPVDRDPVDQVPAGQNPWGPRPVGPAAPYWPPYPIPMVPQARNGMGITALVLGIIGVVLGLAVVLFWLSWLPALLAVIFGFVGLSYARKGLATNRAMALAGVILGVAGLLISAGGGVLAAVAVKEVADDRRAKDRKDKASAAAEEEKRKAEEKARHLSFGQSYTFGNGLKVTVAKPEPFTPSDYVLGHAKGNKAVEVTVTVVNTGTERLPVETGLPRVNDANGASTELVIDGSGRQKVITGYVLPGKEAVGKYAFSLPPDAADKAEVEFSPDGKRWQDAYWSGPLS